VVWEVWDIMREQQYGRIVMTTSSSGLYGNFGQSNYGAAKMALVGLMHTLSLEGEKNGIRVNSLAPTAHTQMTEGLMPPAVLELLRPEAVTPGLLYLESDDAPTRAIPTGPRARSCPDRVRHKARTKWAWRWPEGLKIGPVSFRGQRFSAVMTSVQ
jgi:NAD(P)-dependent dehydrogenase (short-subunit alcohol dehydrogenase family)